jgi:nitroimidazol reductase NimA-like FMN-containing flavoprotein (pyridoxamine 5'-phosphate oxidase superfamily)
MTTEEVETFLAEEQLVTCATVGARGRPHLMPMFYASEGLDVLCFTYRASQKVRNLERLPQATLQVEAGARYHELRGVMLECDAELLHDYDAVVAIGLALARRAERREGLGERAAERGREVVRRQAAKRVGIRFRPTRIASWDHRKG